VTSDYYSSFRVDFYRQEPAGDVYLDSLTAHITKGFQYSTVSPLLDLPELFTTGSYYFTVTALGDGINTSDSQPVKSPVWDYTHPGLTLNATALAWDGTNLLWTDNAQNPEQVHVYNIQYFYSAIANAPIDITAPVALSYCSPQDLPASLDVDLPLHYDTGYFYFRVQVESADPNVAATGEWSELSPALFKVGMYPKVHEAHDLRWDVERHYADQKSRPASGAISFGSMVTGTPTDFRVDFYRQETTGDMYLGSSTVQIGTDQQYGTAYILDAVTQPLTTGSYYCLVTTLGEPYVTSSSLPVQSPVWEYQAPIIVDNFAPYELQWNVKRQYSYENPVPYSGAASFSGTVANGNYDLFQVDFYRQDAAGDIYLDTLLTKFYADERYCTVYPLEEFPELFTTGSYYFVVWEEGPVSSSSQPVKSPIWNYTRPDVTLQASNPVWSSDMSMNWASLSDTMLLDYFEVEIRYNHWGNDLGNSRIVDTAKYNNPNVRPNDDALSAGEGWYFFRVRAQSSDINAATNSAWSDWSAGYHYTQSYNKLGTPSELKWHAARDQEGNEITFMGSIDFKRADPDQGCYDVWFYRAGEEAPVTADRWTFGSNDTQQYLSVSAFIYEDLPSGTYYFKIRAVGDSTNYIHGEWTTSDTWVYRAPATRLEAPANLHWDDSLYGGTDIYIMWESAETDVYYETEVYFSATENGPKELLHGSRGLHETETKLRDEVLEECGNGWYFVRVRAVPEDITQMRISEWSEFSPGYHMTQLSIDVSAALEAINPNAPLADIQQAVADIPHLNQAMAADKENSGAVKRIAALENTMGKTTVNITATTVGFDASGVQVTGAALNAGADATLEIGSVSTSTVLPALTPTQYNNTVTFTLDIPQAEDQNPAVAGLQLAVPVKITLPIPDNINPAFLVVLHYQQSTGAWEELQWPHVYQDGSKWFVTFVVDSMSPFALAEHLVEVNVVAGGVLLNAYLPTAGENMQFLCALYRSNGQMIGTTILDPHNESGKLISANNITADMYVKILSVDTGDGWKPVSAAQKVVITF